MKPGIANPILAILLALCLSQFSESFAQSRKPKPKPKKPAVAGKKNATIERAEKTDQKQLPSVKQALKSLQELANATEIGVTRDEYARLLAGAKTAVDAAARELPDGELKDDLISVIAIYRDANDIWRLMTELGTSTISEHYGPMPELIRKYDIPLATPESLKNAGLDPKTRILTRPTILSTIWLVARKRVDAAQERR